MFLEQSLVPRKGVLCARDIYQKMSAIIAIITIGMAIAPRT